MSLVSTYYDLLVTRISTIFPSGSGWTRISNPYDIEQNKEPFLRQGWGLAIGGAQNQQLSVCQMTVVREFRVTIARELMKLDEDVEAIANVEKQLLEDLRSIVNDFEGNQMLASGAGNLTYLSDNGIQLFRGETAFLYLEATFNLRIVEAITTT